MQVACPGGRLTERGHSRSGDSRGRAATARAQRDEVAWRIDVERRLGNVDERDAFAAQQRARSRVAA